MDSIDIRKWKSYFHDGSLINIKQFDNKIEISMESSEIFPDEVEEIASQIQLSKGHRIRGILYLEGIKNIHANRNPIDRLDVIYDDAEILDFDFEENKIKLGVIWENYFPKPQVHAYVLYKIEVEKFYWENIPDLYNPTDDED